MRVLVTGSGGYIGVPLADALIGRGHDVVGWDTGFYQAGWLFHGPRRMPPLIHDDVRHIAPADLAGFDAVVHLAELSNDPLGELNPEVTHRVNHAGSVRLAEAAVAAGVARFVYMSSCSVYGLGDDGFRTEESATDPRTAYAVCKMLVERDLGRMASARFSPTILRNATVYGPSPRQRFDLLLNNLCGLAWTTGTIALSSDGTPWRPLVHVHDVAAAVACVLAAPREAVHNRTFNVGATRHNYRVREVAGIVAEVFPGCALTVGRSGGDDRSYRVSFDRIAHELPGFRCCRDPVAGAAEFRRLFERIGLSREQFESPAYSRLAMLRHLIRTGQVNGDLFWRA